MKPASDASEVFLMLGMCDGALEDPRLRAQFIEQLRHHERAREHVLHLTNQLAAACREALAARAMNTFDMPAQRCPVCSTRFECATKVMGGSGGPQQGSLTVCIDCASFLVFEADLSVRLATYDEIADLPSDVRTMLVRAREAIRQQQRDWKRRQ